VKVNVPVLAKLWVPSSIFPMKSSVNTVSRTAREAAVAVGSARTAPTLASRSGSLRVRLEREAVLVDLEVRIGRVRDEVGLGRELVEVKEEAVRSRGLHDGRARGVSGRRRGLHEEGAQGRAHGGDVRTEGRAQRREGAVACRHML
jgi:hypothetical protein